MRLLKRFAQGELRLTRIEAFSDGVFAIVVPLGEGLGVRGPQLNKFDRSLNFFATK